MTTDSNEGEMKEEMGDGDIPAESGGERPSKTHRELHDPVRHSETSLGCTLFDEDHTDSKIHRSKAKISQGLSKLV